MRKLYKLFLVGVMLLVGAFAANAQPGGFPGGQMPDAAQIAKMRADQMKDVVKLTDDQYAKVQALFKEEMEEMQKRMEGGAPQMNGDFEAMRKEMETRRQEQNKKLQQILTKEQFEKWTKEEENRRAAFGGPGGPGPR